jgi:hypothetical protein
VPLSRFGFAKKHHFGTGQEAQNRRSQKSAANKGLSLIGKSFDRLLFSAA